MSLQLRNPVYIPASEFQPNCILNNLINNTKVFANSILH